MSTTSPDAAPTNLAEALTAEHHEIDAGIEEFLQGLGDDQDIDELVPPLRRAMDALRRHIYLEEEFAFPPIREGGLTMPIMVMEREHGLLWNAMDDLEERLAAGDSDVSDRCHEMLALLEQHNSKEEPIIYPHLDRQLEESAARELGELITSGTMPQGWVPARV